MQFALTPQRDSTVYMAGVLCKLFFAERLFLDISKEKSYGIGVVFDDSSISIANC